MIVSMSESCKVEDANNQNEVVYAKKYQNEALDVIAKKYQNIDFSNVDDNFVVKVGDICELLWLDCQFVELKD